MKKNLALLLMFAVSAAAQPITTAPSNTVQFRLLREVKDANGNLSLTETKTAKPGEEIIQ